MIVLADLLRELDVLSKSLRSITGSQVSSATVKAQMHQLATLYFSEVQPQLVTADIDVEALTGMFQSIHAMSRIKPSTQRCRELVKELRRAVVVVEGQAISRLPKSDARAESPVDALIVLSLSDICPTASAAYQQALIDFQAKSRLSWRGPATDLREALRETLDTLAPDFDVTAMPNFKLEGEAKRPTMKQKVRYVLKSRSVPSGAMETPEIAVQGVEDIVGGLTRSVYTRSSVSTHTSTSREEASRVLAWVRLVLCELLEIPLH